MISAVVPFRPSRTRLRPFKYVIDKVNRFADEVVVCDDGGVPFSRAASINKGVAEASGDLLWICDADLLVPVDQLDEAILLARNYGGVALPYEKYHYHGRVSTRALLQGRATEGSFFAEKPEWTYPSVGGTCVMLRDTWEIVGGFDERMRGWGHEDFAFFHAAATFASVERVAGVIHHLWHPTDPVRPPENSLLADRYYDAEGDPKAMTALIGER